MIEIETSDARILWTGDIDTRDSPNVLAAKPIECDILCMEGTYGGREHKPRLQEEQRFVSRILEIVSRGGTAIVPSFASGRGQDILRILHREAPNLDVHYDGMGTRVTKEWLKIPDLIKDHDKLEAAYRWSRRVSGKSDRKKALNADVIVTTSGMLDGGPAIWYLNRLRHNSANGILLTGYQAERSGGRMLIDEGKLPIYGKNVTLDLEVDKFDLSNHAGHEELSNFARACKPKELVIFHSDLVAARAIEKELAREMKVHIPSNLEPLEITL